MSTIRMKKNNTIGSVFSDIISREISKEIDREIKEAIYGTGMLDNSLNPYEASNGPNTSPNSKPPTGRKG